MYSAEEYAEEEGDEKTGGGYYQLYPMNYEQGISIGFDRLRHVSSKTTCTKQI